MLTSELVNLGACSASDPLGTRTGGGCVQQLKAAKSLWVMRYDALFEGSQTFDSDYIKSKIVAGDLIPLPGVISIEENGSDDAYETLPDDTMILTNEGKYRFMAQFVNGLYFNKALRALNSFKSYRILMVDFGGNILGTEAVSGGFTGFSTTHLNQGKLMLGTYDAVQKETLMFQLDKRAELDDKYVFVEKANLDFDPSVVEGIFEVELKVSGNTVTAKLKNRNSPIEGLLAADFLLTVGGVETAVSGFSEVGNGQYTITFPTGANVLKLDGVVDKQGDLYKSNSVAFTVA